MLPRDSHIEHLCMILTSLKCIEMSNVVVGAKYWVPRIRLQFSAEDPRVFVERIQFALRLRENTKAQILYHMHVEYMPIWKGTPSLDSNILQSIRRRTLSAPRQKT